MMIPVVAGIANVAVIRIKDCAVRKKAALLFCAKDLLNKGIKLAEKAVATTIPS